MPKKKKKGRAVADPVQDCPLKNKKDQQDPPKYCYLTAFEVAKKEKAKRTRWGKSCEKFVVYPATVRDDKESDDSDGFPVFDPYSENDSGAPRIRVIAVRSNLVDSKNKAAKITATLKDPTTSEKGDDDHSGDDHLTLTIDRQDTRTLRQALEASIEALADAEELKKKIKKAWDDFERRAKLFQKGVAQLQDSPGEGMDSISEAITVDDDEDDDDDDEDDDDSPSDGSNSGSKTKLEATVFPQDPTLAKLIAKAPVALASWCPEKYDWARQVPRLGDLLSAVWLQRFNPRVYNVHAVSCGEAPPDKASEAAGALRAQILVYPADQFQFVLRIPKLAKAECGYEGRYVSATGELKTVKKASVEVAGTSSGDDDSEKPKDSDESEGTPDQNDEQDDGSSTGSTPNLYDPDAADKADNPDDPEDGGEEDEDEDEDDEGTTLFEISAEDLVLPWQKQDDKDKDGGGQGDGGDDGGDDNEDDDDDDDDDDDKDEDDEFKAEVKKFVIKLVRKAQPPEEEKDDEEGKEEEFDEGDGENKDKVNDDGDRELDLRESAFAIFNVIQAIREVWDQTKGLSYTVGFSFDADIGFLEGKLDWNWGWLETTRLTDAPAKYVGGVDVADPGRQLPLVVFSQEQKAKLTILRLALAVKLGIDLTYRGIGFRMALVGSIEGQLDYDRTAVREYCPEYRLYFHSEPEHWVSSEIKGTLKANAILLSADTLRAVAEIETGYWVRARRGNSERVSLAYEWRFLGLEVKAEFKIKGYKNVKKTITLLDATDEEEPNAGEFPTYASSTAADYRAQLMSYKNDCWAVQQELQQGMIAARSAYFSKFFPKQWSKIQAAASLKGDSLIWGGYNDFSVDAWVRQLRGIAKTTPHGEIALGIQHTVRRGFSARSGMASWASRSNIWYPELEGTLYKDNTDLDVEGKDMGYLLWYVRLLGGYYRRFSMLTDLLLAYCDGAIEAARDEEQNAVDDDVDQIELSDEFKEQARHVKAAYRDIMLAPRNHPNATGWKQGKFKECCDRVTSYINGLDMSKVTPQLVEGYDRAQVKRGRMKFRYSLEKRSGFYRDSELTNSNIRWQTST